MVRARRRRTFKREREDATEKVARNVKIIIIVMIYVSSHHENVTSNIKIINISINYVSHYPSIQRYKRKRDSHFKYLDIYNNAFIIKLMVSI